MNWNDAAIHFDPCEDIIANLEALEQAIVEICDVETAQAIHARKKVIQKK